MSYSKLILRDSAEIVWPLDDITESSSISKAINFFADNPYSYSASINPSNTNLLYNPIVFGGGTLLSFISSSVGMSIPAMGRFSELYENKDSVISFWFQANTLFPQEYAIFKKRNFSNIGLFIKDNYLIFRYGTSASYSEVSTDITNSKEPTHIVIAKTMSGITIIVNGVSYSSDINYLKLEKDNQHINNDYLDFYGPPNGSWNIDSIAYYPNLISTQTAKRHYVYGLGKTVSDDVFYSRGGNLYNMSTISTEKLSDINWDYKEEWNIKDLIDLTIDNNGIKPQIFSEPTLYSFDNIIDKSSNSISFNLSASTTKASYIEIDKLHNKIGGGEYPLFLKIKLNGPLPDQYISQRVLSYGKFPEDELLKFDLYNDGGTYKIKVSTSNSSSTTFTINNPTASTSLYIGMKFIGNTTLYFAQEGYSIQSASFSYLDNNGYGLDPLISYFPPSPDMVLRIGSSLNYDDSSFQEYVYNVEQFYGSVQKFMVVQQDFIASANYSYLDSYRKSRYEFNYDSIKNRFKVKTYGYGNFILHSVNFTEILDDEDQRIGANIIKFGYPDVLSASQVYLYVTHKDYDENILYPKTKINQDNYFNFINSINIADSYLQFDFEIYSEDSLFYPPKIKYFQMQTFKNNNSKVTMRDDAGQNYVLYQSSSVIYLPEIRYTPTVFMTEDSGLKLSKTIVDFTENILAQPLDPNTLLNLKLWLDARYPNGLGKIIPDDDSRLLQWNDLSGNNNHAIQNISASAPVFRVQSLNLLRSNQLNGSDTGNLSFISYNGLNIESSPEGVITGVRGIKTIPNGTTLDSYIDLTFNTASISTFSNQSYSVVASIKLDKPQTGSALHNSARKIVIYNTDGVSETLAASSYAATNTQGVYSLSAIFTTDGSTIRSIIRLYNGSADNKDYLSWDNIGLYPLTSGSYQYSWIYPLTQNDHPVVKFDGKNMLMVSSASSNHPSSLYIVARNFGDSIFLQNSASILYSNSGSYFASFGTPKSYGLSSNKFHIFTIINSGTNSELFIDGLSQGSQNIGSSAINQLILGRQLRGDIASILLYSQSHTTKDRQRIENWLNESFLVY